jgi:hypothetical protein
MRLRRVRDLFIRCWKFAVISVIGVTLICDYRGLKIMGVKNLFIIYHTGKCFNFQLNSGTGFRG